MEGESSFIIWEPGDKNYYNKEQTRLIQEKSNSWSFLEELNMTLASVMSPLHTTRLINSISSCRGELISDYAKWVALKETERQRKIGNAKPRKKIDWYAFVLSQIFAIVNKILICHLWQDKQFVLGTIAAVTGTLSNSKMGLFSFLGTCWAEYLFHWALLNLAKRNNL